MNYKLLLQLKKAGFPFLVVNDGFINEIIGTKIDGPDGILNVPDLSELIDACGDGFDGLEQHLDENENYRWQAWYESGENEGLGKTPEEAVAKLYLKLNESRKELVKSETLGKAKRQ